MKIIDDTTCYEFGSFVFDANKRVLWDENRPLTLTPKNIDTLKLLIEQRGRVLEKNELLELLWPDSIVEENNLTQNISALRKALGEKPGEQKFIKTIPGRGYRFIAEVQEVAPADLIVQESKMCVVIEEETEDEKTEGPSDREIEKRTNIKIKPQKKNILPASRIRVAFLILSILAIILLIGGSAYWRQERQNLKPQQNFKSQISNLKSLAVLPFKSLTPKNGEEYLGVGIADVIITRLSNLNQLTVRPTSSVLSLGDKDALQAGQALKVDSVLDGSIQQIGDRVRVTVRLLRVSDGQALWAYQCDQQCNDVFQLQDLVSANLTQALALKLTSEEQQRMNRRYTDNAAAYQAYLKGRYHTLQYTPEGNKQAIAEFNEALKLDPNYALAYAGLADAYAAASESLASPREALSNARSAAEKALALDDTLAEAHAALGHVFVHQRNPTAESEFHRAMELSPNSAAAIFFYFENFYGRDADKAAALLRRVQELDPLSPTAGSFIASSYLMARRNDEALQEIQKTLSFDPNNPMARDVLGMIYGAQGNHLAAISELEKVKQQIPTTLIMGQLGREYALAGKRAEALKTLAEMNQLARRQYVSPFDIALIYVGLDDRDQAFSYLEKALEDQSEWMGWIASDARFDSLRSDPRFAGLLRRIGLAQ